MPANSIVVHHMSNPVAILDKDLLKATSFTIMIFELCTLCGARFGIGYQEALGSDSRDMDVSEELPRRLTEILAKDHRQNREHKHFIDLDF